LYRAAHDQEPPMSTTPRLIDVSHVVEDGMIT
jgi:hypothetical protein